MAYPDVSVVDDFNRANEGPPMTGWVVSGGTGLNIVSLTCQSTNFASYNGGSWNTSYGPNAETAVRINQIPALTSQYHGITVRLQTANDYDADHYALISTFVSGSNNDTCYIEKQLSAVATQLGATISLGADLAANDVIGIRATSTTIEAFRNGSVIGTRTDSDVSGAGYGGFLVGPDNPSFIIDRFYAGTVAGGGGGSSTPVFMHHMRQQGIS